MELRSGSEGSEFSDHSDYGSEVSDRSTLAEILERFTIEHQPECTFKLRFKAGPVITGADLTRITAVGRNVAALVIKPTNQSQVWRRLRIDSSGMVTLRSRKLRFWFFTLDASGHANPFTKTFDFSYRLATKWDLPRGEYRNKRLYQVSPQTEARLHWSIAYSLPAVEGSLGSGAQQRMAQEVRTDMGYAHLTIPRVELVCWPRGRPDSACSCQPGAAEAEAAAARAAAVAAGHPEMLEGGKRGAAVAVGHPDMLEGGKRGAAVAVGHPEMLEGGMGGAAVAVGNPEMLEGDMGGAAVAVGQPEMLEGGRGGRAQAGVSGSGGGGRPRGKAGLSQLSSHVASLSGRWWDTHGRQRCGTPSGQLLAQCGA